MSNSFKSVKASIVFTPVGGYDDQFIYPMFETPEDVRYLFDDCPITHLVNDTEECRWSHDPIDSNDSGTIELTQLESLSAHITFNSFRTTPIAAEIPGGWSAKRFAFKLTLPVRQNDNFANWLVITGFTAPTMKLEYDTPLYFTRIIECRSHTCVNKGGHSVIEADIVQDSNYVKYFRSGLDNPYLRRPRDIFNVEPDFMMGVKPFVDVRSKLQDKNQPLFSNAINDSVTEFIDRVGLAFHHAMEEADIASSFNDIIDSVRHKLIEKSPGSYQTIADLGRDTDAFMTGHVTMSEIIKVTGHEDLRFYNINQPVCSPLREEVTCAAEWIGKRIASRMVETISALYTFGCCGELNVMVSNHEVTVSHLSDRLEHSVPNKHFTANLGKQLSNIIDTAMKFYSTDDIQALIHFNLFTETTITISVGQETYTLLYPSFASALISPVICNK